MLYCGSVRTWRIICDLDKIKRLLLMYSQYRISFANVLVKVYTTIVQSITTINFLLAVDIIYMKYAMGHS